MISTPGLPPGPDQGVLPRKRKNQVASPAVAGAPWPGLAGAAGTLSPSPHELKTRCKPKVAGCRSTLGWRTTSNERLTSLMMEPVGMASVNENCRRARFRLPLPAVPALKKSAPPRLASGAASIRVVSATGWRTAVSARRFSGPRQASSRAMALLAIRESGRSMRRQSNSGTEFPPPPARFKVRRPSDLQDAHFATNRGQVDPGDAASQERLVWSGITWQDDLELIQGGPEMLSDHFAEHGAVVGVALQVTIGHAEHGAPAAVGRIKPIEGTVGREFSGTAIEHARRPWRTGDVLAVAFDGSAGHPNDPGFGMVGALVRIFHGGRRNIKKKNHDDVIPGGSVRVERKVFPKGVEGPTDAAVEPGMRSGDLALGAMSVKSAVLSSGNDGIGLIQHDRGRLKVIEKVLQARVDHVFIGVVGAGRPAPAAVFEVGGREEEVASGRIAPGASRRHPSNVAVRLDVVLERVAGVTEIDPGKQTQGLLQVLVLQAEQFATQFRSERDPIGGKERGIGLGVSGRGGDAEQIVTRRIGQIGHGRPGTAEDERQRGLDGDAGERRGVGQAGLVDRAIKDAVVHQVVVRGAVFPITLRVEVGARLSRIGHAMDQRQLARVVNRGEELEGRMQRGETVSQAERRLQWSVVRICVAVSGADAAVEAFRAARGCLPTRAGGHGESGATGGILGVTGRNH